jgi:hypothetical protein
MHTPLRSHANRSHRSFFATLGAALSLTVAVTSADASAGWHATDHTSAHASMAHTWAAIARESDAPRAKFSEQEYFSFSGVGAIVCTVNGERRNATAFLVGAFDIGVTVAHTFVNKDGTWIRPKDCVYTTVDSVGQVRERIPVAYVKAQWASEAGSFGQAAKDFAVIRLAEPSRFAQRTMPLGKYSGAAVNVLMVGFNADFDTGTVKLKSQGRIYERAAELSGFIHDMNARAISAGAPVIDERSGVTIGIHTQERTASGGVRNTMITMNEWLESTLRAEMTAESAAQVSGS